MTHACLKHVFPQFMARFGEHIEEIQPPLTDHDLRQLETRLGIPLPASYKTFLQCTRGFMLDRPMISFLLRPHFWGDTGTRLFFADYFKEADGDQVFFEVSEGLRNGEYPVYYYSHEDRPPAAWKLADSFIQWLEELRG